MDKKGKGKVREKAQGSANVLDIMDLPELPITSSESINFSCYKMSEKVEWFLDNGCTDHITPRKSNIGNFDKHIMQKLQMGNTSELRVMEQLLDIA